MSEENNESPAAEAASPVVGGSKLMMTLTLVNSLVSIGIVTLLFISHQKETRVQRVEDIAIEAAPGEHSDSGHGTGTGESAKKVSGFGKMITLDQFTVNLTTPGSTTPKYVRVNISLEVPGDEVEAEVTQRMPQVRNAIIDLFNSKRPADVVSEEGRQYLKEEIRSALNGFMISGKVKGVFFTNFALSG